MDLSELDTNNKGDVGEPMSLLHPGTKEPLPGVKILLVGMDSEKFRTANRTIINRRIQNQVKRRTTVTTVEEIETEAIDQLAQATVGWENVELDGKVLPFTVANARLLYTRFMWIREQVDVFVGDRANFLKPSPRD